MSEMIERVARAIRPDLWDGSSSLVDSLEFIRNYAREQARDAIQAMREPTEAMPMPAPTASKDQARSRRQGYVARHDQRGPEMSEWQPIETAPKDGTQFLCFWKAPLAPKPEIIIARWNADPPWLGLYGVNVQSLNGQGTISHLSGGFDNELFATHWMPLPQPPEAST